MFPENLPISFSISKKLNRRGFNLSHHSNLAEEWYDSKGNVTKKRTNYPRVSFCNVTGWLEEHKVLWAIYPIADGTHFLGKVFKAAHGAFNEKGEQLYDQYGRHYLFKSWEAAYLATVERAVLVVPVLEDDLPF